MDGGDARRRGGCRVLDGLHSVQAAEEQYLSDFLLHSIILTRIENRAPYDTPATTSPMVSEHFLLCLDLDVLFFLSLALVCKINVGRNSLPPKRAIKEIRRKMNHPLNSCGKDHYDASHDAPNPPKQGPTKPARCGPSKIAPNGSIVRSTPGKVGIPALNGPGRPNKAPYCSKAGLATGSTLPGAPNE